MTPEVLGWKEPKEPGGVFHADLPADLTSARHARFAVRLALAAWGMGRLSDDAELLASELSGIPKVLFVTGWQPGAGPGRGGSQHLIR
jgi:hypothetical protein